MLTQQVPSLFINFAVLVLSLLLAGVLWYDDLLIISFELLSYLLGFSLYVTRKLTWVLVPNMDLSYLAQWLRGLLNCDTGVSSRKGVQYMHIDVLNTAKKLKWQCPCYIALKILVNQLLLPSIILENLISLSYMAKDFTRRPEVHVGSWRKSWASWLECRGSSASWIHNCRGSHEVEFDFHGLKL